LLGLPSAISSQFTLKVCAAAKNCKKFTKIPILGVQGRSRSSMLINLKSLSPLLVTISSMCVPICNCFHTIQEPIAAKWRLLGEGYFFLTLSFEENPLTQGHEILSR